MGDTGAPTGADRIAAIILAAGRSSRMGEHKLLLPLGGRPLLAWSLAAVCASHAEPIILALGRAAPDVLAQLPPGPYSTVINQRFEEGMGTTLALAVTQLPADVTGAIVTLGDQPFMSTQAIDAVLAAARAHPGAIAMGVHAARRGHPVYLPRRLFGELARLSGDEGARTVIGRERDRITLVPLEDERLTLDVDTPEDYERAKAIAQALGKRPE